MKNIFNSIKLLRPKKNVFDLSHDVKLSLDMGELVPTMCMECIPGDKFNIGCESLLRFAPLVSPVMHRMNVFMHYFFVPNRILWPNWENFITNTDETPGVPYVFPTIDLQSDGSNYTRLHDYLGLPSVGEVAVAAVDERVSALPMAAYQKIYNDYYRDQNLIADLKDTILLSDGDNTANSALSVLRKRAWMHDYFTAALPFAQKGNAVSIPLDLEDVRVKALTNVPGDVGNELIWDNIVGSDIAQSMAQQDESTTLAGPNGKLFLKGDEVNAQATITDLRRAFKLQEWLEKAARGGSRYVENIWSQFGVKSPDARLQRPEYITGTKSPVVISEVLNTTGVPDARPQGDMAGHGISVTSGKYGSYYCQEHGYIIGIMSVMPMSAYQQGIPKHFLKYNDAFEFYWNSFANIGEQEVVNKEIYAYQAPTPNDTFGYVPRYAEYKYMPSRVAGEFRTTLNFWHLGRFFNGAPALNQQFVEMAEGDVSRIFAVTSVDDVQHLYAHVLHKVRAVRAMPKYGNPSF